MARSENLIRFARYWGPVLAWMGIIFWMSSGNFSGTETAGFIVPFLRSLFPTMTLEDIDLVHGTIRKAGHVIEYCILGLLTLRAFRKEKLNRSLRSAISAALFCVCYAATDEFHQSFIASREASLFDIGIDSVGIVLSQMIAGFSRGNAGENSLWKAGRRELEK